MNKNVIIGIVAVVVLGVVGYMVVGGGSSSCELYDLVEVYDDLANNIPDGTDLNEMTEWLGEIDQWSKDWEAAVEAGGCSDSDVLDATEKMLAIAANITY